MSHWHRQSKYGRGREAGSIPGTRQDAHQKDRSVTYAFTDHRVQGRAIPSVTLMVDTPRHRLGSDFPLSTYILRFPEALEGLQLLQDFDDELCLQAHPAPVLDEDDSLEAESEGWVILAA